MNFAENLKAILKDRNLKQVDLCRDTGISTSIMSEYINGNKEPGLSNLSAIANALNLGIDELLIYTEKTKEPGHDPTLDAMKARTNYLLDNVPPDLRSPLIALIEATLKSQGLLDQQSRVQL
jgi:transcriptional regulator with XRE-family HTH domain